MELTRDKCENACLYLLGHCYEEKEIENGTYKFMPSGFEESEIFKQLIEEHFDNEQKIEWLRKVMDEEAFKICFKDEKSAAKWYKRIMWHIYKTDELGRELQQLKDNQPLQFDDLKENMWIYDNSLEEYMYINMIDNNKSLVVGRVGIQEPYTILFEKGRFYKKEIENHGA